MTTTVKDKVRDVIYAQRDKLVGLAHDIHEHPELGFCEEYAAARITKVLADEGFVVRSGIGGMPTAFVATIGNGPLHVAFCAEYDALPPACMFDSSKPIGLGEIWLSPDLQDTPLRHACGHHLIAGASVSAATGLRDFADEVGLTVSVFGTPCEELVALPEARDGRLASGKIALLKAGAFEGMHAALMIHPMPTPWSIFLPWPAYLRQRARFSRAGDSGRLLGVAELRSLKEALQRTVIALHLIPLLYVARPEGQNNGAQADLLWLTPSLAEANSAREAVRRCFEEAATSAGVAVQVIEYAPTAEMRHDPRLSASYRKNAEVLGRVRGRDENIQDELRKIFSDPHVPGIARLLYRLLPNVVSPPSLFMDKFPVKILAATDLGNVSQVIPSIEPYVGIGGLVGNHSPEFAAQADTDEAYRAMLDGGIALAWTALDAATDPALRTYLLESASSRNGSSSRNA